MNIIKSIYWEQNDMDEIVYRFPFDDISLGSVLTVNESQEAYLFKNGTLCDCFKAGRHVLSTENIPLLQKLINLPNGGKTTFMTEVWFISKLEKRNMYWGTGGLRIIDPYFQIPIKLSSRGQYGFRIEDGGLFLKKMVGTMAEITSETIDDQFRIDVIAAVKVAMSKFIKEKQLNINELGSEYKALAREVSRELQLTFSEYGVELLNFSFEDISFDENDKGYQTVMEGIAEQARLSKLGVSYLQQKQLDIAETAAGNEGAGNFMGVGMGLGAGQQLGGVISQTMQNSGIGVPPPPPAFSYYIAVNGETKGPFGETELKEKIHRGELHADTYVYKAGGSKWVHAKNVPEINALIRSILPPPPPPAK